MKRCRTLLRLAALLLFIATAPAHALCTITCACAVSTTNLQFGLLNPLSSANTDSAGNVRVSCGGIAGLLIPYRVDLTKGNGPSYTGRRMSSGANTLAYNLYQDSNRQILWGDGTGNSQTLNGGILLDVLGLSPPVDHAVHGRIPGSQTTVVPGVYGDSISVTLTYY